MARGPRPLGTDWHKPFLETAPYLIVVFRMDYEPARLADGTERHRTGARVPDIRKKALEKVREIV